MPAPTSPPLNLIDAFRRALPLAIFLGIAILCVGLYMARSVVIASAVGVGLGVLITPIVSWLKRKLFVPRGLGAALMALVLLAGLSGFLYLVSTLIANQLIPLFDQLPAALERLHSRALSLFADQPWLQKGMEKTNIAGVLQKSVGTVFQGLQVTSVAIGMLVVVVALAAYLSVSPDRYLGALLTAFPAYKRQAIRSILRESASELRKWFLAQLVGMVFVGAITGLGLWLIGLEYWLLIGFITAVCEFIPYLGPILATFLAVIVTLGSQPDKLLWVIGLFLLVQQLESNIITPVVLKKGADLPPVHLLVFALLMGLWFGLLGVLVAAPVFAVARTIYLKSYAAQMDRQTGEGSLVQAADQRKMASGM